MHDHKAPLSVAGAFALLGAMACSVYSADSLRQRATSPSGPGGSGLGGSNAAEGIPSDSSSLNESGSAGAVAGASTGGTSTGPILTLGGLGPVDEAEGGAMGLEGSGVCNADTHEGQRIPLDMYFLVDSSLSMNDKIQGGGSRWSAVTAALTGFVQDPQNAESAVGLGYFPIVPPATCQSGDPNCLCILPPLVCITLSLSAGSCDVDDYAKPTVPLALPPNGAALVADLQSHTLNGGTPTRPALEGSVKYVTAWTAAHPDRKSVIVLATDGEPLGCATNQASDVAQVAADALAGPAKIQTFVIGVGSSLQSLNLIAKAGGTDQAYLVEDSDATSAFTGALEKIRGVAAPCSFFIPTQSSKVDPTKVNVQYTPKGSTTSTLLAQTSDGSATTCGTDGGWYYDDPTTPTSIELCPTTCQALGNGKVAVEFGCRTLVRQPR